MGLLGRLVVLLVLVVVILVVVILVVVVVVVVPAQQEHEASGEYWERMGFHDDGMGNSKCVIVLSCFVIGVIGG
jgi:heme/copper-type cytochrome/quinol oxidase subunit 2